MAMIRLEAQLRRLLRTASDLLNSVAERDILASRCLLSRVAHPRPRLELPRTESSGVAHPSRVRRLCPQGRDVSCRLCPMTRRLEERSSAEGMGQRNGATQKQARSVVRRSFASHSRCRSRRESPAVRGDDARPFNPGHPRQAQEEQ
jgi:hypothetical protein